MAKAPRSPTYPAPDEPGFVLNDYPLYALNRVSATYVEEMSKALKTIGMDQPRWRVLTLLDDRNPSTVTELSRRSVTKLSTITRIVMRMEAEGLVTRKPSPTDSRVTEVFITEKGRKSVVALKSLAGNVYRRAMEGLSDPEITSFAKILRTIEGNLSRHPYVPRRSG